MMDFTIGKYRELLNILQKNGYSFQTFEDFLRDPQERVVILRHDVDLLPENSLLFAKIQKEYDIQGTYYFRAVPESWNEDIIKEVKSLGHEVGYHYETMDTTSKKLKGINKSFSRTELIDKAFEEFCHHLERLRNLVSVSTICMHGSPKSSYDNKEIWKNYDYRKLGLIGEPYFDINFDRVYYLTDTGRRWDGYKVSVRDKVKSRYHYHIHSTDDLIEHLNHKKLPEQIMINFHPQRWHNQKYSWTKELVLQNIKNLIKQIFYVK